METQPFINGLVEDVKSIIKTVENDFSPLEEAVINWKADAESWSILECFEHLNIYNRYYNNALKTAILKAKNTKSKPTFKSGWFGKMSIDMMKPSNTKKQKTMTKFNPVNSQLDKTVIEEFLKHQYSLLLMLEQAKRINISKNAIPVEFFKLIKMKIGDTFTFVIVHQQRHLQQAKRVLETALKQSTI